MGSTEPGILRLTFRISCDGGNCIDVWKRDLVDMYRYLDHLASRFLASLYWSGDGVDRSVRIWCGEEPHC